ncbi:RNA polymerase sigma factor [Chitinophaga jiangningensis]|nr:sigma-70 family RNA polymerase sigma factor [Chitinophaga jiangningensis]
MPDYLPTDMLILERLADNDRSAFEELYNYYFPEVINFSMKYLENRQAAEDITIETFVKLWNKRSTIAPGSNVRGLLFTIARNACLNHLRDEARLQRRHQELALLETTPAPSGDVTTIRTEIYNRLYQEIALLPGKMPQIMQLSLKGLKNTEIAEQTGIAEKTVRNLKTEAIKQLRTKLLKQELLYLLILLAR